MQIQSIAATLYFLLWAREGRAPFSLCEDLIELDGELILALLEGIVTLLLRVVGVHLWDPPGVTWKRSPELRFNCTEELRRLIISINYSHSGSDIKSTVNSFPELETIDSTRSYDRDNTSWHLIGIQDVVSLQSPANRDSSITLRLRMVRSQM